MSLSEQDRKDIGVAIGYCEDGMASSAAKVLRALLKRYEEARTPRLTFSLDCPECGEEVFEREDNAFTDGEEATCSACKARVMVSCDSETEPYAVVREVEP